MRGDGAPIDLSNMPLKAPDLQWKGRKDKKVEAIVKDKQT